MWEASHGEAFTLPSNYLRKSEATSRATCLSPVGRMRDYPVIVLVYSSPLILVPVCICAYQCVVRRTIGYLCSS